ncbi:hypothetical protein [Saccharomonospora xinjiangensis]|uniref:Uncharacterized protein n=1 Tax=Saccharomonospora xinjiangensis XJ-54 TaxID=882086 RepID=I0V7C4_9PSEU|nr:hypothetical protein [Saccharomonospora xinjiangensis]EID56027.1 hypothetical protein SacxiDRAFT_3835 [Saccharomonospora xinjiangensis XJ-54]
MTASGASDRARAGIRIDRAVPGTSPGLRGAAQRFFGPGTTRAEIAIQVTGTLLGSALLTTHVSLAGGWSTLSPLGVVVLGVLIVDLVGGVLTNATNSAKRWYHRDGATALHRIGFAATHGLHLVAVAVVLDAGGWHWVLVNAGLLLGSAVAIEALPVDLARPSAMALYLAAVLVNLTWLPLPGALVWIPVLFFLKLLVCHLVPEAPLTRVRPHHRSHREQR